MSLKRETSAGGGAWAEEASLRRVARAWRGPLEVQRRALTAACIGARRSGSVLHMALASRARRRSSRCGDAGNRGAGLWACLGGGGALRCLACLGTSLLVKEWVVLSRTPWRFCLLFYASVVLCTDLCFSPFSYAARNPPPCQEKARGARHHPPQVEEVIGPAPFQTGLPRFALQSACKDLWLRRVWHESKERDGAGW